ncbi:hypothetical protein [Nocardia sp. NBC_01388]|uniref:hypothetical protein n=1 Tax=Nocardia sp. NBC_01388 TaxID=2903596 RepID=UPI003251A576
MSGSHGGHGGHDMGMMLPGGLAMADREHDRDGLQLDVLTVPLGPATAWWPAGLVVTTRLQGDLVSAATVSALPPTGDGDPFWLLPWLRAGRGEAVTAGEAARWLVARRLDSAATLLTVAGWAEPSMTARRLRDELLAAGPRAGLRSRLDRWSRKVGGCAVLRWSLRDVGRVPSGCVVPPGVAGDTHDRLLALLADLREIDFDDETPLTAGEFAELQAARGRWIIDALPGLLTGTLLSEARLIVAGLDPDMESVWWATATEAAHG